MRKIFCVLGSFFVLSVLNCEPNKVFAKDSQSKTSNPDNVKVEVSESDLPVFSDLNSILQNEHVQQDVRYLQAKVLELLKNIGRSNPDSKGEDNILGTPADIDDASRRIKYLVSLESNLEQADSLERIRNILKLNKTGRDQVDAALNIIDSAQKADTFEKLKNLTFINKNIFSLIDKYENLENKVKETKSFANIKDIPGISEELLKDASNLKKSLDIIKNLSSAEKALNNSLINKKLKKEISDLLNLVFKLKKAKTIDQLRKISFVQKEAIDYVDNLENKNKKLQNEVADLTNERDDANKQVEVVTITAEKNRRFVSILVGTILRALIGFDYRNNSYNFAKLKELKVTDKTALIAASKTSFSHLGGTEEDLYKITNTLQEVLKIVLSDKNWMNQVDTLRKKLELANSICKKFNEDALIIKRNVNFALQIIDYVQQRKDRPPKDIIENFEEVASQKSSKEGNSD